MVDTLNALSELQLGVDDLPLIRYWLTFDPQLGLLVRFRGKLLF